MFIIGYFSVNLYTLKLILSSEPVIFMLRYSKILKRIMCVCEWEFGVYKWSKKK